MALSVGDTVEVLPRDWDLGPQKNAVRDSWTGRCLTVIRVGVEETTHRGTVPCAWTVPSEGDMFWYQSSLRKIDPPDWQAPALTEKEVVT